MNTENKSIRYESPVLEVMEIEVEQGVLQTASNVGGEGGGEEFV